MAKPPKIAKNVVNPNPQKIPKWTDPLIGGDEHPLAWRFSSSDSGGPFAWAALTPSEKFREVIGKLHEFETKSWQQINDSGSHPIQTNRLAAVILEQYAKVHEVYSRYQEHAEKDRRQTAEEVAETCVGMSGAAFTHCIVDQLESHYRDQATNQDLLAQKDMAFWAFWVFVASIAGLVVTAVGVYYVRLTLNATAGAVEAAGNANALLMSDQRPWVDINLEGIAFGIREGVLVADVLIVATNTGRTPAVDIECNVRLMDAMKMQLSLYAATDFYDSVVARGSILREAILPGGFVRQQHRTSTSLDDRTYSEPSDLKYVHVAVAVAYRFSAKGQGLTGKVFSVTPTKSPHQGLEVDEILPWYGDPRGTMYSRVT